MFGGREKKRKKAGEKRETLGAHELEVFHLVNAVKNKLF